MAWSDVATLAVRVCGDVAIEALLPPSARQWPLRKLKRRLWRALAQLERAASSWVQDGGCAPAEESAHVIRLTLHRQRWLPAIVSDDLASKTDSGEGSVVLPESSTAVGGPSLMVSVAPAAAAPAAEQSWRVGDSR